MPERGRSGQDKKGGARKAGGAGKSGGARKRAETPSSRGPELSSKNVAELREALTQGVTHPLDLMMLTRAHIEEVVHEAVERGRITADDAQNLVGGLVERGRKQTNDVLGDLERLLGRGRDEIGKQAAKSADPVLARADRARRAAGLGPSFPVTSYDHLTAAQVQSRIADLTPPELRKVRDYERRHANRKTVLNAIAEKLG